MSKCKYRVREYKPNANLLAFPLIGKRRKPKGKSEK